MRNFANSLILPFQGATGAQAITAHKKSNQPPQAVSLDIPWRAYALQMNIGGGVTTFNGAVSIDLARGTVSNPLDIVKSVFIDNTSVDRPVYLRCEDTGQIVTCADGSFGWYPLLTYGEQFTLFTDNIIPLRDANQRTKVIFSNASFDTFSGGELNRAQSLFRASGSSQYTTPVIADRLINMSFTNSATSMGVSTYTLIPPTTDGIVCVTGIRIGVQSVSQYIHTIKLRSDAGVFFTEIYNNSFQGFNDVRTIDFTKIDNLQLSRAITNGLFLDYTTTDNANSTGNHKLVLTLPHALLTLPALSA